MTNPLTTLEMNVGKVERVQSAAGGALLTASGLHTIKKHPVLGIAKTLVGAYLLYRAASGSCILNKALGRDTSDK
jgi:uncharacterized membrane protein